MRFWDTSGLVTLCLKEQAAEAVTRLLEQDQNIVVWWGTVVECRSAFARLRHEKILTHQTENEASEILESLAQAWAEIEPTEQIRQIAARLLRLHSLTAADSLQLAAALVWADRNPRGHEFVCLDQRLAHAAELEGFKLPPL